MRAVDDNAPDVRRRDRIDVLCSSYAGIAVITADGT